MKACAAILIVVLAVTPLLADAFRKKQETLAANTVEDQVSEGVVEGDTQERRSNHLHSQEVMSRKAKAAFKVDFDFWNPRRRRSAPPAVEAACPAGSLLTGCMAYSASASAQGTYSSGNKCIAQGDGAYAQAKCLLLTANAVNVAAPKDQVGLQSVSCPAGTKLTGCSCSQPGTATRCGATSSGNTCTVRNYVVGVKAHARCATLDTKITFRDTQSATEADNPSVECEATEILTGCSCVGVCKGAETDGNICIARPYGANQVYAQARCATVPYSILKDVTFSLKLENKAILQAVMDQSGGPINVMESASAIMGALEKEAGEGTSGDLARSAAENLPHVAIAVASGFVNPVLGGIGAIVSGIITMTAEDSGGDLRSMYEPMVNKILSETQSMINLKVNEAALTSVGNELNGVMANLNRCCQVDDDVYFFKGILQSLTEKRFNTFSRHCLGNSGGGDQCKLWQTRDGGSTALLYGVMHAQLETQLLLQIALLYQRCDRRLRENIDPGQIPSRQKWHCNNMAKANYAELHSQGRLYAVVLVKHFEAFLRWRLEEGRFTGPSYGGTTDEEHIHAAPMGGMTTSSWSYYFDVTPVYDTYTRSWPCGQPAKKVYCTSNAGGRAAALARCEASKAQKTKENFNGCFASHWKAIDASLRSQVQPLVFKFAESVGHPVSSPSAVTFPAKSCTSTKLNGCTAHPIDWYQNKCNVHGAGYTQTSWQYCGGGGQYICTKRYTCSVTHLHQDCC